VRRPLAAALSALLLWQTCLTPAAAQTTEADVYVAQAVIDFDDKRYTEALANLRRALELEPDHVEALYYMGVVNMAMRRPAEAVRYLEQARRKSPTDASVAFQLGLAFFALERYEQAEPLFEEVFRRDPTIEGLGYYVGFLRYRKKDYRGALAAFRAGRTQDPQLQQLTRFYTGLTLAVLGLPAQASREVEQALALVPGSALTGPAERLRDTLVAARQRERRFTAEVRLGFLYDDNVIVRPSPSSQDPLASALRERSTWTSTGEIAGVRFDYSWFRSEQWDASAGYSFFTTYYNDLPSFNITNHMVNLGLTHKRTLGPMPAQFGLSYAWDTLFLNEEEFIQRNTVSLTGALVESERHLTQVFGRFQHKEFFETRPEPPKEEFRDADNYMAGFIHLLRFAEDRHLIKLGYQFDWEDARGRNYEYVGHRALVGFQYTLGAPIFGFAPKGDRWWSPIRLKYDIDVHWRDYLNKNTLLPTPSPTTAWRRDREMTNSVRAEIPLQLVWEPFIRKDSLTLSAEYQATVTKSTLDVFEFTRNVFSLVLSWTY
jgi:tetratricopeptide (TPR) repeat protein